MLATRTSIYMYMNRQLQNDVCCLLQLGCYLPLSGACMWLGQRFTTSCRYSGRVNTGRARIYKLCATPSELIANLIGHMASFCAYSLLRSDEYCRSSSCHYYSTQFNSDESKWGRTRIINLQSKPLIWYLLAASQTQNKIHTFQDMAGCKNIR